MMESQELYLDLMKRCLTRSIFKPGYEFVPLPSKKIFSPLRKLIDSLPFRLVRPVNGRKTNGEMGWPLEAETMIGLQRLDHLQHCIVDILEHKVPGDFIETGVWRGGAVIMMRAVLRAYQEKNRVVWAADSFSGLPKPDAKAYPADSKDKLWTQTALAVPLTEVKENFQRYDLLDEQVRFLEGVFKDTLPHFSAPRLSLLRLDGDLYESTMEALTYLYPKLSVGGYVIIDDYGALNSCRKAVEDYRTQFQIREAIIPVDSSCVYWKRLG